MSVLMILYRPGYASWIVAPNHRKSLRNILKTHKTEHEKLFAAAIKHASRVWIVQFIESAMLEKGITFDFFFLSFVTTAPSLFKDVATRTARSRI